MEAQEVRPAAIDQLRASRPVSLVVKRKPPDPGALDREASPAAWQTLAFIALY